MSIKTIIKKWYVLTVALVLLLGMIGISAVPAAAAGPTPTPTQANLVVGGTYTPGTGGTELDIMLNNGPVLPGWCVNESVDIYVNTSYPADIYNYLDYYGTSYPDNVDILPSAVTQNTYTHTSINWPAITYILNNPVPGSQWQDVQQAIWYFSDGDVNGLTNGNNNGHPIDPGIPQAYVDEANAYLSSHNNSFIPTTGQVEPEICYVPNSTPLQVIFYLQAVPALPDLVITSVTGIASPTNPAWYSVSFTVKNQGNADASATSAMVEINGSEEADPDVPALPAGASATVTVPSTELGQISSANTDTILVTVNPDYAITESDYSNDSASTTYSLYNISASAGSNGAISPSGVIPVGQGTNQSFTITPDTNYHIASVTVDGNSIAVGSNYTFNNVDGNHTIGASFAIDTFNLSYAAGANGSITGSSTQTVNYGASGTAVTAVSATGYHFVSWSDGSTTNPRTDANVGTNISVTANFAVNTFNLTYAAGANGSIMGSSTQTVNNGANGTAVNAVPATGYHFVNWSDGSTANPRTDANVTADISVTANFAITTFNLSYTAGANGSITGSSTQTVNYGASGTAVTAVPATGYHFVNWSDGSTTNPRTDTNVASDISVTANFVVNTFNLTYTAGANGSITGSLTQTVNYGASGTAVTAVAANGYHFINWSDGSTVNPRTDTNVTSDISVTANFASSTCSINATATGNGSISVSGDVTVGYGGSWTFSIVPASGYEVNSVLVDGVSVGSVTTYTFNNVTTNHTIDAIFQPRWDVDGNHIANINDVVIIGLHWDATVGSPNYLAAADVNDDGVVNITDVVIVGLHWGETW